MAKTSAQPIHFDSGLTEYAIRSSMKARGPEVSKMARDGMLTMNWWIDMHFEDLLIANGKRYPVIQSFCFSCLSLKTSRKKQQCLQQAGGQKISSCRA